MTCVERVTNLPARFHLFAKSQDIIGWGRFMEGMVSKQLVDIQKCYLACSNSRRSIDKWMNGLISQLLQVTHAQWIYRNFLVHNKTTGALVTAHKEELLKEIDKQLELGTTNLLDEDHYLLEINLDDIATTNGNRHEYWLLAIQAARKASLIQQLQQQQQQQSQTT